MPKPGLDDLVDPLPHPTPIDARADIYALGAVGYWLLTGTHVFSGTSMVEVCAHHLHSPPEPPSVRLRAATAADLETLILDCLAKKPQDRPASARILRDGLRSCANALGWNNDKAAAWWLTHRDRLRPRPAELQAEGRDPRQAAFTVTRRA